MGQIIAIHITATSVRLAVGGLHNGKMQIRRTAYIAEVAQFFENGKLLYMKELVALVVANLRQEKMRADKKVVICYGGAEINVEWVEEEAHPPKKGEKNIQAFFQRELFSKRAKGEVTSTENTEGKLIKAHQWGTFVTGEKSGAMQSVTEVDQDFVQSFALEFAHHGYCLLSFEPAYSGVMYLRHILPYHYDNMAALLFYADEKKEQVELYTFIKNTPSKVVSKYLPPIVDNRGFADELILMAEGEVLVDKLRRPAIILGGDAFRDYDTYDAVVTAIEAADFTVYDVYDYFRSNLEHGIPVSLDGERNSPQRCGLFTVCIALLCRSLDSNPDNLLSAVVKKRWKWPPRAIHPLLSKAMLVGALLSLLISVIGFSMQCYQVFDLRDEIKQVNDMEYYLDRVQTQESEVIDQWQALGWVDYRFTDVLTFASNGRIEGINIVSIDSDSMMLKAEATASTFQSVDEVAVVDDIAAPVVLAHAMEEMIVLRGFAAESHAPMELYNNLVQEMIGTVELLGIRQMTLPNKELVYAFEIGLQGVSK